MATATQNASNPIIAEDLIQTDELIERDRASRALVAIFLPLTVLVVGFMGSIELAYYFKLYPIIGQIAGAVIGVGLASIIASKSFVVNEAFIGLLTTDPLAGFLGKDPYVSYGPGFHFRYFWERVSASGVVNLVESTEPANEIEIPAKRGSYLASFAMRLRPDLRRLREYLAGAGAVVGDIKDLVIKDIAEDLSDKEVSEGITRGPQLNQKLLRFKHGDSQDKQVSKFEERFGVMVGDVTISTIKGSKEIQKAIDGAAESSALSEVVARTLGYPDIQSVHQAVAKNKLTSEQVATAHKLALAMTDNLHGMNLNDTTFNLNLTGDPEMVKAVGEAAPALAMFIGKKEAEKKPRQPRKPKGDAK